MSDANLVRIVAETIYDYQYSGEAPDLILAEKVVQVVHDWTWQWARLAEAKGFAWEMTGDPSGLVTGRVWRADDGDEEEHVADGPDRHEVGIRLRMFIEAASA
jgi:hypothetical protein